MNEQHVIIDNIKWWVHERVPEPLCRVHNIRLRPIIDGNSSAYTFQHNSYTLKCEEGGENYDLPRSIAKERLHVIDKIDAKIFANQKFINLDDEALPIAEDKVPKDTEYFVTALLAQSKVGLRLVVYAGKRGSNQKTQIFVEPEIRRLAFDQKDLHPNDVFTKVEATFRDGTTASTKKEEA